MVVISLYEQTFHDHSRALQFYAVLHAPNNNHYVTVRPMGDYRDGLVIQESLRSYSDHARSPRTIHLLEGVTVLFLMEGQHLRRPPHQETKRTYFVLMLLVIVVGDYCLYRSYKIPN